MKPFLRKHLDDVMIALGCALIVAATVQLSWIAALYVAGGMLVVFGILAGLGMGGKQ